jgi:LuxR family transcriptional regulator, quorum-sensing system regulator SdiA
MNKLRRAGVAALLHDLDQRSPAGCADRAAHPVHAARYMFQSYPKRWMDQYSGSGLIQLDPTVRWGMSNVGWILWGDLEAIDEHGVLERAKDFGLMNGLTVAVLIDGSRSIASFARSDRDYESFAAVGPHVLQRHVPGKEDPGVLAHLGDVGVDHRPALGLGVDGGKMCLWIEAAHKF